MLCFGIGGTVGTNLKHVLRILCAWMSAANFHEYLYITGHMPPRSNVPCNIIIVCICGEYDEFRMIQMSFVKRWRQMNWTMKTNMIFQHSAVRQSHARAFKNLQISICKTRNHRYHSSSSQISWNLFTFSFFFNKFSNSDES